MTEDNVSRVSDNSSSKPRRKRKWDQPHESLVSTGNITGSLPTSTVPTILGHPLKVGNLNVAKDIQSQILPQQAVAVVQKLLQPKIQEDLVIAREIVINDADPAVRYKLTKRLTQEEIQKCTGAVVITRGKYRPPNAVPDGEKPLYLHISAGAHLKETAERIIAVDRAAAMVEEMLKQVCQPLSTCVYLGFDADPSLNIVARIHGPNDQYINHIINETGATVTLRGRGSGFLGNLPGEEGQKPLHLFLSSNNHKSLEEARLLAENLLDTISRECGATRASSCNIKVYSAVPPPQQLLTGVPNSLTEMTTNMSSTSTLSCSTATTIPSPLVSSVPAPITTTALPYTQVAQPAHMLPLSHPPNNGYPYSQAMLPGCTSYGGYAGLYPQATPLQQVALALRQSNSPLTSAVSPSTSATSVVLKSSVDGEKRPPHKRKFQESPVSQQGSNIQDIHKRVPTTEDKNVLFSPSKKLGSPPSNGTVQTSLRSILPPPPPPKNNSSMHYPASKSMPPPLPPPLLPRTYLRSVLPPPPSKDNSSKRSPPSKSMPPPPPPPPPPKFTSTASVKTDDKDHISHKSSSLAVPDTLVKLMEYGDDDDDDDDTEENENEAFKSNPNRIAAEKPFWAV